MSDARVERTRDEHFRALHRDTYADLLRFVERRVPASEAEDIVSMVFLTAWRRFDELPEDTRPWLFAVARKTMFVERVTAGEVGGRPAHRPVGRWLGVGAAAVAAGVVAAAVVPALLPGAAEKAVASWTAAPSSRTGGQVLSQARACARNDVGGSTPGVRPAEVLLAEQRGDATLLIMQKRSGNIVECLSAGQDQLASMGLTDGRVPPPPPAGTVSLETMSSTGSGDSTWSNIVGLVGSEVTGVDVRLDDGRVFQTSVKAGWWAAEGGEVDHLTVLVHTPHGTTSYRPSELP